MIVGSFGGKPTVEAIKANCTLGFEGKTEIAISVCITILIRWMNVFGDWRRVGISV